MIIFLLSLVMLLYIFEFKVIHAQNYAQNNKNKEIDNDFDYIFDPGNYIESEKEEKKKNEKVIVRNDNSHNDNKLVKSSSSYSTTSDYYDKQKKKNSNNSDTVNRKNSESKLKIIEGDITNNNNNDIESLDYITNDNQDNQNTNDKVVVKTRLNLENLDKIGYLNIAAFINGQGVLKNVSLDKINPAKKTLIVNLAVNKETDIVKAGSRDEFFVCAYHIKNMQKEYNTLPYFDCDEGDLSGSDGPTISRLFSPHSLVYKKSQNIFNNSSGKYSQLIIADRNNNNNLDNSRKQQKINETQQQEEEKDIVKIKIYAPLEDRKDIQKLKIMSMVKGKIKSAVIDNVQEEFKKIGGYKVSRTFTFDRDTNIGKIQIGDRFHACVSSEGLNPPEGTECEKRTIKYLGEKENVLYAR